MIRSFGIRPFRKLRERILRGDRNLPKFLKNQNNRQRILATPPWADFDFIRSVYKEAERLTLVTGIKHTVDHDIPLNHKMVCGLHVHTNLKAIPEKANSSKGNEWNPYQLDMFDTGRQLALF